jgi:Leucine-rich repeat (LRR) protein
METVNVAPASGDLPAMGRPVIRDWIDVTVRLATSWAGLFTAYVIALILGLTKFQEYRKDLHDAGIPQWVGVALIVAFPLFAIVFSTIPTLIDQRRIKRYSEITGPIKMGYFTLRPRENEEGFERADNAHQEIFRWIENTKEPVLYLTGASGTGKSSLLLAWVIPKLKREKHVVIQLRGYEDDLLARIKDELLQPGVIWEKAPGKSEDFRSLLLRATQRLDEHHLFIVVDQFEEFLILANQQRQNAFRQFLSEEPIGGLTFLLVYRPEYEGFFEEQPWPKLRLDTNRRTIRAFTECAAQEFMRKSGLTVNAALMRAVLREVAEIEQTVGLIRPININLCGLVLSRFSSGLPHRFRGGLIRGFLRESLSLPEVRDVAGKLIPQLISDNITKQPRTIATLALAVPLGPPTVRACLRRLGESDRAIVRPLDEHQETWEISHDFLVPLLDAIVARRTASLWRRFRPWLPWTATAVMGIGVVGIQLMTRQSPKAALITQGWTVSEVRGTLRVEREDPIPPQSVSILHNLPPPFSLTLSGMEVTDVSALRELKNLTELYLPNTNVTDVSALRELTNLTELDISGTQAKDVSALQGLKNLRHLKLNDTQVTAISGLRELTNLTELNLGFTRLTDLSVVWGLKNLTKLNLSGTQVPNLSGLRELTNLTDLSLSFTYLTDISAARGLKNLTHLYLAYSSVTDLSALRELTSLTELYLMHTPVTDLSALRELKNLTQLDLSETNVTDLDLSALRELKNLTDLNLRKTKVTDLSALRELTSLRQLDLSDTKVTDLSALRKLNNLKDLNLNHTNVTDFSALQGTKNLKIQQDL